MGIGVVGVVPPGDPSADDGGDPGLPTIPPVDWADSGAEQKPIAVAITAQPMSFFILISFVTRGECIVLC